MLPHTLNWTGFWWRGRLKHQDDVDRKLQSFGFGCTGLIQLPAQKAVLVRLTHQSQNHLEVIAVEVGELIEARLSGGWFHDTVQVGVLKLLLHFAFRFDTFGRDFAPTDRLESEACRILAEEAYWPTQSQHGNGIPDQHRQVLSEFF
ncbi:MAG TPA: hypothetical protein V6D34_05740 [Candidatus Sericytochromatia bacterium]